MKYICGVKIGIMKNFFIVLSAALLVASCNQNDAKGSNVQGSNNSSLQASTVDTTQFTSIQWIDSVKQDLGTIKEGQTPEISWRFKNTGSKPLVIQNASATCGCTIAEKPEQPIMPGKEGAIKAKFNSEGRLGPNAKQVIVSTNTKDATEHYLGFTVVVEKK